MIRFVALLMIVSVSSVELPPEIIKCRLSDPRLGKCLEIVVPDAILKLRNGNADLGVVPLEPLVVPQLSFENAVGESVTIRQEYYNLKLNYITNTALFDSDANFSDDNCYWKFKTLSPMVRIEAIYRLTGRVIAIPINGHGRSTIILQNLTATYDIKCEKYVQHGKKYVRISNLKLKTSPTKANFDFENIIDGNEQLSQLVVRIMNDFDQFVYGLVGVSFDDAIGKVYKGIMDEVFYRVPEDGLFLP